MYHSYQSSRNTAQTQLFSFHLICMLHIFLTEYTKTENKTRAMGCPISDYIILGSNTNKKGCDKLACFFYVYRALFSAFRIWSRRKMQCLYAFRVLMYWFVDKTCRLWTHFEFHWTFLYLHCVCLLCLTTSFHCSVHFIYKTQSKTQLLRISRWWKQTIRPSRGPCECGAYATGNMSMKSALHQTH